jgi:hypothetical protein
MALPSSPLDSHITTSHKIDVPLPIPFLTFLPHHLHTQLDDQCCCNSLRIKYNNQATATATHQWTQSTHSM